MKFLQSASDFPITVSLGGKVPDWGLSRWGDGGLRFVPPDDEGFALRGDTRRLVYKGRRCSHRFTILGDTAFEYDVILEREPESNVVVLKMEGAERFDFFRQPDFIKEPLLAGSYAVYKKETLNGEGTGKLCHIHRPEIIDSRGRRCWGDLDVSGNELRITIPETFLSEAVYPVIVDPLIGTTTVGSQSKWNEGYSNQALVTLCVENAIAVNRFPVSETINGTCKAYIYTNTGDGEAGGRAVLYSDNNNVPLIRKSKNEDWIDFDISSKKVKGWREGTFQTRESIPSGTNIWFGVYAEYLWYPRFDYGAKCYFDLWDAYESIPEAYPIFKASSYYDLKLSMYFTYTDAGQSYIRTLTQGVTLNDNRKLTGTYYRKTNENVQGKSIIQRRGTFSRQCLMTAFNVMNIKTFPALVRSVREKITAATVNKQQGEYGRYCVENVQPEMNVTRKARYIKAVLERLGCTDFYCASLIILLNIREEAGVNDTFKLWKGFLRCLTESVSNSGEAFHSTNYHRMQEDRATAGMTVFRGLLIFVKIMTTGVVRDVLSRLFVKSNNEAALKSVVCREISLTGGSMARIYAGQSALRLTLKTFTDLEHIQEAVIKYRKPDGVCGKFTAGIADSAKGVIFHECEKGEINLSGWWTFWAFITFADGRTAAGQTTNIFVWEEGR